MFDASCVTLCDSRISSTLQPWLLRFFYCKYTHTSTAKKNVFGDTKEMKNKLQWNTEAKRT